MEFNFEQKIALVMGATKGIGRAIAVALWKGGATVYALVRTQSDFDSLKAECPGIQGLLVDLRDWTKTKEAVKRIGQVDLLVNNAGVVEPSSVLETLEDNYTTMMDVMVKAVVNVTQVVAKGMVARRSGAIVNMSSIGSRSYAEGGYIYCAAKAALDQLTRCQAVELGPHQVRVNAVNPTAVMTDMVKKLIAEGSSGIVDKTIARMPISHPAEVKDVVNATLYLLSDKAGMINGAILPVEGGYWCA